MENRDNDNVATQQRGSIVDNGDSNRNYAGRAMQMTKRRNSHKNKKEESMLLKPKQKMQGGTHKAHAINPLDIPTSECWHIKSNNQTQSTVEAVERVKCAIGTEGGGWHHGHHFCIVSGIDIVVSVSEMMALIFT